MKLQIAFDKPLNDNAINFVRIGRTIWPIRAMQVTAPMRFLGIRRADKYGSRPLSLRSELFRGVEMDSGEIYTLDHRGQQCVFSYFNPKDRKPGMKNFWPAPPGSMGLDDSDEDGEMGMRESIAVMTHQYMSLIDESVLICTEYEDKNPSEQQIIIDPETPPHPIGEQVDSYDDYVKRFGDG